MVLDLGVGNEFTTAEPATTRRVAELTRSRARCEIARHQVQFLPM